MSQHLLGTGSDSYAMQYPVAQTNYSILSACSFIRVGLGDLMIDRMTEPLLRNESLLLFLICVNSGFRREVRG
jgi:hypothetical protein